MSAGKHAYLIMAHNNFEMLQKLIRALDDSRNDLYIHVDAKVVGFDPQTLAGVARQARLELVERIPLYWGGYSQIALELHLLKAATKTHHDYYHLISGVDIPLKTQDEMHAFFRQNQGAEFVSIDKRAMQTQNFTDRYQYYHLFPNAEVRAHTLKGLTQKALRKAFLLLQKFFRVNRAKNATVTFYKGANWFSITHELAVYTLQQKAVIEQLFSYSFCGDEVFLQTIAMNSPFKDRITGDCLRFTDWQRGMPYTFREEDYPLLVSCDDLFARKFDYQVDPVIVDKLYQRILP